MRGILAAAGAASVAAVGVSTPLPPALAANVLTLEGYTFIGTIEWDMEDMFQGAFCSQASGNSCTEVEYASWLPDGGEADGLRELRAAIATTAPPTTVLGFSQGATIASNWIRENAGKPNAPSAENLSFVLAANPQRKYGGIRTHYQIDEPTPDSQYAVLDIAVEYDGAADFPTNPLNLLAVANALAGFQYVHIPGYNDIDLDTAEKLVWTEGNTTYVLIRRENLPLLEPLRILGFNELADTLNGPLKEIIDSAYDRNYPGLVDPALHDEVLESLTGGLGADDDTEATARFASLTVEPGTQDEQDDTEPASSTTDLDDSAAPQDQGEALEATPETDDDTDEEVHEDAVAEETADDEDAAETETGGESTEKDAESEESAADSGPETKADKASEADTDSDTPE